MRVLQAVTFAVCTAVALGSVSADAASHVRKYRYYARPGLIVPVAPRSFLDPGPIVPTGSLSNYVYMSQYPYSMPYSYTNHYGRPPLPTEYARPQIEGISFGPLSGY